MNKYVKSLMAVMKETHISHETAGRLIGCSSKTVHRWLTEESDPRPDSEQSIRKGIERIRAQFPTFKTAKEKTAFNKAREIAKERKKIWGRIKHKLTVEDKLEIAELMFSREKDQMKQLKKLDQKYNG